MFPGDPAARLAHCGVGSGGRRAFAAAAAHLRNWPLMLLKRARLLLLVLLPAASAFPETFAPPARETLQYSIEWRLVTAGKARLEWTAVERPDPGWQVRMHVESVGLVSRLFKVEDDYRADLSRGLCAQSVAIDSHEGSRRRETRITFDAKERKADYLERDKVKDSVVLSKETEIPACVHDVVGGLFYMRTLDLAPGQSATVPVSDGKKSVLARVEAQQREQVKTPAGTFQTVRYEVYLFNNVLYRRPAHLNVWLTDDRQRLPVQIRVRMQFTIGTLTLQLESHE
jgi:hypothetical protein